MSRAVEAYVKQNGIFNTEQLLKKRIHKETNLTLKEFFINCKKFLKHDKSGRIQQADSLFYQTDRGVQ